MDRYIVTAGYVTVETQVGAGRARIDVARGELLPGDVPAEDRERLLGLGHIAPTEAPSSEPVKEVDPDAVPDGTIAAVLGWVAGDKDRAAKALEAEQAKGDKARSTLVTDLEQLAQAAGASNS